MITLLKKFVLLTVLLTTLSCDAEHTPFYTVYGLKNSGTDTLIYYGIKSDTILDSAVILPDSILSLYILQTVGGDSFYSNGAAAYDQISSFSVYRDTVLVCKNLPQTDPIFLHGHDTTYQLYSVQ